MTRYFLLTAVLIAAPFSALAEESFGPVAGDREITLAGTGASDEDIDNGTYGISGDFGWYTSRELEFGLRQSVNYAQINNADDTWNGATRVFTNYHFDLGRARPFVGASVGGVYGDGVEDTGFAGPEFGLKYYVRDKTFIYGRAEYQFFFSSSDDAEDNFDDGSFVYSVGLGYHF